MGKIVINENVCVVEDVEMDFDEGAKLIIVKPDGTTATFEKTKGWLSLIDPDNILEELSFSSTDE